MFVRLFQCFSVQSNKLEDKFEMRKAIPGSVAASNEMHVTAVADEKHFEMRKEIPGSVEMSDEMHPVVADESHFKMRRAIK